MTAKFLNNYPAKNALRIINQNRRFFIVIGVLSLLGIPMMLFTALLDGYFETIESVRDDYEIYFECGPYVVIGAFCAGVAVLMGMFCGIRAYEEEWNKTRVDMFYALPLNGTQRFFSNYAGGFLMYIIPYIMAVLIGWIIMLIMIPMITGVPLDVFASIRSSRLFAKLLSMFMYSCFRVPNVLASSDRLLSSLCTSACFSLYLPNSLAASLIFSK